MAFRHWRNNLLHHGGMQRARRCYSSLTVAVQSECLQFDDTANEHEDGHVEHVQQHEPEGHEIARYKVRGKENLSKRPWRGKSALTGGTIGVETILTGGAIRVETIPCGGATLPWWNDRRQYALEGRPGKPESGRPCYSPA